MTEFATGSNNYARLPCFIIFLSVPQGINGTIQCLLHYQVSSAPGVKSYLSVSFTPGQATRTFITRTYRVHTHGLCCHFGMEFHPRWWLLSGIRFGDVASKLSGNNHTPLIIHYTHAPIIYVCVESIAKSVILELINVRTSKTVLEMTWSRPYIETRLI
jgi:hypothetical protein